MVYTAKIEQTFKYKKRMRYLPATDSFEEKDVPSRAAERDFVYPSGWLKESGTPPCEHLDVIVMTEKPCRLGDEFSVRVVGVFVRSDGDCKLAAVETDRDVSDLSELPDNEREALERLYRPLFKGEGWFGKEQAEAVIAEFYARRKRKLIIMIQHTESVHHTNGHIGAGYDWELTERGRQQAFDIGKWLLWEDCARGYEMFVSPQKRALQTAEEINRTLHITPEIRSELREVDAGEGNGKPRDWYREHEAPKAKSFDIDYRPFPDAESDRDVWQRIEPFYREILDSGKERILIVSHGTALSFLQSMLMGYAVEDREHFRFVGSGGSISKFIIEPDGRVICSYLNHRIF